MGKTRVRRGGNNIIRYKSLSPTEIIHQLPNNRFSILEDAVDPNDSAVGYGAYGLSITEVFGPYAREATPEYINSIVPEHYGKIALWVFIGEHHMNLETFLEILKPENIRSYIAQYVFYRPRTVDEAKTIDIDYNGKVMWEDEEYLTMIHNNSCFIVESPYGTRWLVTDMDGEDYETFDGSEADTIVIWMKKQSRILHAAPAAGGRTRKNRRRT